MCAPSSRLDERRRIEFLEYAMIMATAAPRTAPFPRRAAIALIVAIAVLVATLAARVGAGRGSVDWPVHGGTDLEQRYSPLAAIDRGTVGRLGLAWSFELPTSRGQEATPIVVDGVMYVASAWSHVDALDAATGRSLWSYDPQIKGRVGFDACCDVVTRGVAVADGKVFLGALDGRLIALDQRSGKPLWTVQTTDPEKPYTITGAPRIVGNKVVIGNGGAEYGVRGYVTAYAIATGQQVWRFYTVPGDPSKPADGAASDNALRRIALPTWAGHWYDYGGGGTAWDAIVYDPELHQLYIGVGNGSPWNWKIRSDGKGDNLFLSSIVAVDPDTGRYKWHYQETPGETWDFTATQPIVLATLKIGGSDRKVLMQAPKNGFFYVVDRTNGKLISAKAFVPMNWASGVDMKTGRPIENPAARYFGKPFAMQPSGLGGHSWHPMAYSAQTGLVYLPTYDFAMMYGDDPKFHYRPGVWNNAIDSALLEAPDDPAALRKGTAGFKGRLVAWNPVTQTEAWSVPHEMLQNGGVLATAGGLVFQGTGAGRFEARDAATGRLLWSHAATDGIIAGPISYAIDGVQYVAVLAGYGGGFGLGEGVDHPVVRPNGRVLVFRLDGKATLLAAAPAVPPPPVTVPAAFTQAQVDSGRLLYTQHCYRCHGAGAQSTGVLPDLRRSGALGDAAAWHAILIDGALEQQGMVSFAKWLTPAQIEDVRAYVALKAKIVAQDAKR
jgi:quinohemoprotein ethanol dehydrogenase